MSSSSWIIHKTKVGAFLHQCLKMFVNPWTLFQPFISNDIDLNNEIFHVLDYDGHECGHYDYEGKGTRDTCLMDYMNSKSMEALGCITPYLNNKSNICIEQDKAVKAQDLYVDLKTLNSLIQHK